MTQDVYAVEKSCKDQDYTMVVMLKMKIKYSKILIKSQMSSYFERSV